MEPSSKASVVVEYQFERRKTVFESTAREPFEFESPVPVRSVKYSEFKPNLEVYMLVDVPLINLILSKSDPPTTSSLSPAVQSDVVPVPPMTTTWEAVDG